MSAHARSAIRRAAVAAAGAALAISILPSAASASSIAFIKDGEVWLTSPDGARQVQVTHDSTQYSKYNWPSQADDGTILAKYGTQFVRLRPDGTRIGAPVPGLGSDVSHSGNLFVMSGPNDPRISPDGTRFAYWLSARSLVTCPIWDPGCSFQDTDYTIVSRVDHFTAPSEYESVRDYRDPSWIGNDKLLVFNYGLGVKEGAISTVGAGEPGLQQWFDPPANLPQIGQGQLTRQGDKLVTLAGTSAFGPAQQQLFLYGVSGGYPTEPEPRCYIAQGAPPSGKFLIPSWSPDGTALAVTESDGIHVIEHIPDLRDPNADCGVITDRVLVNGSAPGWGPADVPSGTPSGSPPTNGGSGPGQPGPGQPGSGSSAGSATVVVAKRQRGRAVRVRVQAPAAGTRIRVSVLARNRALLGSAARRAAAPGTLALKVPLNRRGRAALARSPRLRLSVRVAVAAPGRATVTVRRAVTLRR